MEVTVDIDQVKRTFIEQGRERARQLNNAAAVDFENAAKNRAIYWTQVQVPKPTAPKAVEAVFEFEPTWKLELKPTSNLVSSLNPDSLLPAPPNTDVGAVGGPIGSPILDDPNDPVKGKFHMSSTDTLSPGMLYVDPKSGRRFFKVAEGFAGLRKYWLEIK